MACRPRRLPRATANLIAVTAGIADQERRAREIAAAIDSYVRLYSVPLVDAARRGGADARRPPLSEGKRRVDAIRSRFDRFLDAERRLFATREERAEIDARRAIVVAAGGLAGSVLVIVLFGGYLTRAIALPVRRAAVMAGRLAGGDLATRMPETGAGEIGALERAFNTMGSSLEQSRDELRTLAEEQAALRRVATLVARAVTPAELLDAVAAEAHLLLAADVTRLIRFEPDGSATGVAGRAEAGVEISDGEPLTLEAESVITAVRRTGRPARMDGCRGAPGSGAAGLREHGVRGSAGAPITVGRRPWGVMVAAWKQDRRCRRTRKIAWRSSPTSSPRPSRTPRAVRSWPPHAPASWRPPTRRAGASSATCTTAPNSAWSTP